MLRQEAIRAIYPDLKDHVVVTIMGATAAELYACGHRPNFFYLEHAMGIASSMGLGIALARPDVHVVVLDGDGSVLMNLGTFTTMARYEPRPPGCRTLTRSTQPMTSCLLFGRHSRSENSQRSSQKSTRLVPTAILSIRTCSRTGSNSSDSWQGIESRVSSTTWAAPNNDETACLLSSYS